MRQKRLNLCSRNTVQIPDGDNLARLRISDTAVKALKADGADRLYFDDRLSGFAVRVTKGGSKLFVIHTRVRGTVRRISLGKAGEVTATAARQRANRLLRAIADGEDPITAERDRQKAEEAGSILISDFLDRWLDDYVDLHCKPSTAADYRYMVKSWLKPQLGKRPLSSLDRADVIRLQTAMKKTPARANTAIANLRKALNWAEDVGLRPQNTNPCRRIKMFRSKSRERFLSDEELERVAVALAECEADGKITPFAVAGIRIAIFTGMRKSEVCNLRWQDLDLDRGFAMLEDSKTGRRPVYLPSAAVAVIKATPKVGPYVVAGQDPKKPYQSLTAAWAVVRERAGLPDVRLHDLRHSFASVSITQGTPLAVVGQMLGHADPRTTKRYAHLAAQAVIAEADKAGRAIERAMTAKGTATGKIVRLRRRKAAG